MEKVPVQNILKIQLLKKDLNDQFIRYISDLPNVKRLISQSKRKKMNRTHQQRKGMKVSWAGAT